MYVAWIIFTASLLTWNGRAVAAPIVCPTTYWASAGKPGLERSGVEVRTSQLSTCTESMLVNALWINVSWWDVPPPKAAAKTSDAPPESTVTSVAPISTASSSPSLEIVNSRWGGPNTSVLNAACRAKLWPVVSKLTAWGLYCNGACTLAACSRFTARTGQNKMYQRIRTLGAEKRTCLATFEIYIIGCPFWFPQK